MPTCPPQYSSELYLLPSYFVNMLLMVQIAKINIHNHLTLLFTVGFLAFGYMWGWGGGNMAPPHYLKNRLDFLHETYPTYRSIFFN